MSALKSLAVSAAVTVLVACITGVVVLGFAPDTEFASRAKSILAMAIGFTIASLIPQDRYDV